jgi:hypothetical protein
MDPKLVIALSGALVNFVLAVAVPCALNKTNQPFLNDVKKVLQTNRDVILASSIIVAITIYLALSVAPSLNDVFSELSDMGNDDDMDLRMFERGMPPGIARLVNLNQ